MPAKNTDGAQDLRPKEKQRLVFYCILVTLIVVAAAFMAVLFITRQQPAPPNTSSEITVRGTLVCLPHKDSSGPQTLECAFGLKTSDNRHYMLHDISSSHMTSDINTVVEVHGTLSPPDPATQYDVVGAIAVDSLQPRP